MDIKRSDIAIFNELNPDTGFHWLPGHWLAKRLNRPYYRRLYTRLAELHDEGFLYRDKPNTKKSKHSSWARTSKADAHLKESPRRSRDEFKHRILEDMDTASIAFGIAEDAKFRLERWPQIIASGVVPQSTLNLIKAGKNPHYITLNDKQALFPDGAPLKICTATEHIYTIKEIDRATEPGRTKEERRSILQKIRNIKEFVTGRHWRTHYGFDKIIIRFVTIHEARKRFILDIIKEEIGPCKYIGVVAWRDWGNHDLSKGGEEKYPPPDGWAFHVPYERVGFEPYYLNRFTEMDR